MTGSRFSAVAAQAGKLSLHTRCHQLPRTLQDDYIVTDKVLGSGMSGEVKLAHSRVRKGQHAAVKSLRPEVFQNDKDQSPQSAKRRAAIALESEVSIFLSMDHPHVTRLYDVYESHGEGFDVVMECLEGGSLAKRMLEAGKLPEARAGDAARQMLLALNYIHSKRIAHRDLKLDNFLFDQPGSWHLKLVDFGLSKFQPRLERMQTCCGTAGFLAPDVLKKDYSSQCDMWSFGVIVFVLLSGCMPFRIRSCADSQVEEIVERGYCLDQTRWWDVSLEAIDFVQTLLREEPHQRPTARTALDHPWMVEANSKHEIKDSTFAALQAFSDRQPIQRCALSCIALFLTNFETTTVRQEFTVLDVDNDGVVRLEKLKDLLKTRFQARAEDADAIITALDMNGKGVLCYSTFLAAMLYSLITPNQDLVHEAFTRFDQKGSGFIDAADLECVVDNASAFGGLNAQSLMKQAPKEKNGHISYACFSSMCMPPELEKEVTFEESDSFAKTTCKRLMNSIRSVGRAIVCIKGDTGSFTC